jgi:uncharacterized protein
MLWGGAAAGGALELRRDDKGGVRLSGRFPYDSETELAPGRRERFAPGAFGARVASGEDVHLLAGHDFDRPLASRAAGTLTLRDDADALTFEATLTSEAAATSWARDFLSAHAAGLIRGLSPGFRVAPGGDAVERRGADLVRTIRAADLFELSAVTVPAYPAAQLSARNWQPGAEGPDAGLARTLARWRA